MWVFASCKLDDPPDPPVIAQSGDIGFGSGSGAKDCTNQTYNGPIGGQGQWDGQAESFCRAAQVYACGGYDLELEYSCTQLRDYFGLEDECPYCP